MKHSSPILGLSLVVAACVAPLLAACGGGSGGSGGTPKSPDPIPPAARPPAAARIAGARGLFIGTVTTSGGPAHQLMQVDAEGAVTTVGYEDADAQPVTTVETTRVEALGDGYLALDLTWRHGTESRDIRALSRVSDGKLFDLSAYNLAAAQLKGDHLYAISTTYVSPSYSYTMYDIDVATVGTTLVATPMNNPGYDVLPFPSPTFLVDGDGDLMTYVSGTSGSDFKVFFHDNTAPATVHTSSNSFEFCPHGIAEVATVYGQDGTLFALCFEQWGIGTAHYQLRKIDFTSAGPVAFDPIDVRTIACSGLPCPEAPLRPATSYTLQSRDRYLPVSSGYFTMAPSGGGVSLAWTDKALPAAAASGSLVSGEHLYWKEGDTIRRIAFAPSSTAEDVVTATNIIAFKVANGVLFYTRYDTGTSVGTYAVFPPGAQPLKLASDDMQLQYVVELH